MILVHMTLAPQRPRICSLVASALAGAVIVTPADAGQPFDPFQTEAALHERTPGLNDPIGRDCALSAGALTFAEAVDLALCRNPSTRAAWAAARQQAAALGIAESAYVPQVGLTGA